VKDFDYYIEDFMLYCVSKNLSKKTMKSYEQTLKLFQLYMEKEQDTKEVDKVDTKQIREYISYLRERGKYTVQVANADINRPHNRTDNGKNISMVTINNYIRNIKVFFNYLDEEHIIKVNPVTRIKQLKVYEEKKEPLQREDVKRLLNSFNIATFYGYRDYMTTKLLLSTGARIGETLSLEMDDLNFRNNTILFRDTKNKKEKLSYLTPKLSSELKKWCNFKERYSKSQFLFPTTRHTKMSVSNFEQNLRRICDSTGLEVTPHRLRRTFATDFLKNNGSIYILSQLLDHSDVKVTELYLNLDREDLRKEYLKHATLDY